MATTKYRIGEVTVEKIEEQVLRSVDPLFLYPHLDRAEFNRARDDLVEKDLEASREEVRLSIHSWLVRTPDKVVLVDAGSGNNKKRPQNPSFHMQSLDFLARLEASGVRPEDVDYVINTHLHVDHSGWNTILRDGSWVPTFPNARYLFPETEVWHYGSAEGQNDANWHSQGVFEDSVLPIIEGGVAVLVPADGGEILKGFEFLPTPGHSIGHMSIRLSSEGQLGLFGGDVLHHPLQVYNPEWNTTFCEFADKARASRDRVLQNLAETDALYFATHFPGSSAGRVSRRENAFAWSYE